MVWPEGTGAAVPASLGRRHLHEMLRLPSWSRAKGHKELGKIDHPALRTCRKKSSHHRIQLYTGHDGRRRDLILGEMEHGDAAVVEHRQRLRRRRPGVGAGAAAMIKSMNKEEYIRSTLICMIAERWHADTREAVQHY